MKKAVFRILVFALLGVLVFSISRIVFLLHRKEQSKELNRQLTQMAVTVRPEEPPLAPQPEADAQKKPAYDIPIAVDFDALKQQAPDIRGWLYCPDTPIHYPVVQGKDNRYYLRRLVNGQANHAGSIFLDSRNPADLTGYYNLIHGHNLKDDTMFGTLPNYKRQEYYDAHKVLYFLTPEADYVIELFAGFTTDSEDIIYTIPLTAKQRMELAQESIARSDFVSQVQPKGDDKLVILSTCAYDYTDARYALMGIIRENEPYAEEHQ